MKPATAADVCDGNFKSKNITVHGNATIVKQTGPKLVYTAEQWKVLEMMTIVKEKYPIAQESISLQSQLSFRRTVFDALLEDELDSSRIVSTTKIKRPGERFTDLVRRTH